MSVASRVRSRGRKATVTQHRLSVFERAFDKYIEGRVSVGYVRSRAIKLKELQRSRI